MKNLFSNVSTFWVRYSDYCVRTAENGKKYLTVVDGAMPEKINPFNNANQLVLDAINILHEEIAQKIKEAFIERVNSLEID